MIDARAALGDPERVTSARVLREVTERHASIYVHFARTQSLRHRETLLAAPLPPRVEARHARLAEESLATQRRIEASDEVPFETYREQYINQSLLGGSHLR
jgi:glutamate--cysteine ligase